MGSPAFYVTQWPAQPIGRPPLDLWQKHHVRIAGVEAVDNNADNPLRINKTVENHRLAAEIIGNRPESRVRYVCTASRVFNWAEKQRMFAF